MLRIHCPFCGVRDELEYIFGGPAHVTRPPLEADDQEWTAYLYNRVNPKGPLAERWCHAFGCGRWFNAVRDTVTNKFLEIHHAIDPVPTALRAPLFSAEAEEPATDASTSQSQANFQDKPAS